MKKNVYIQKHHDKEEERKFEPDKLEKALKPLIIELVERAFRKYCKAHGAPKELEELEWTRFKKILNGIL